MDIVSVEEYFIFLKASIVVRTAICLIGIFTNALNMRAFYRIGIEDSVTVVFFGLAISDFCHLSSALIYIVMTVIGILDRELHLRLEIPPGAVATVFAMTLRAFTEITNLTTTFLALQRCLCVALPLHFKGIFTLKRVVVVLVCIWVFNLSLTVMLISQHELVRIFDPSINSTRYIMSFKPARQVIAGIVYTTFGIVLNATNQLTILICVVVLASVLTKSVRFRQKASSSGATKRKTEDGKQDGEKKKDSAGSQGNTKEKQAIIQVALVSTIFLICNTPRLTGAFVTMIEPRFDLYGQYHFLFSSLYVANTIFEIFNSSVNFFVYYNYNAKFRSVCFAKKKD